MILKLGFVLIFTLANCVAHEGYSYVRPIKQLSYNRGYNYENPYDQWSDEGGIPGVAGKDYPIFRQVPWTRFVCDWKYPGYYVDPEADCQAYHICQRDGRKDSFLCPNGTLFNQERLVCTWWYTVDCSRAQSFYSINEAIAKAMEEADRRIAEEKLSRGYHRESNVENKSWNKNWQNERQEWNKYITPIHRDHNLDSSKQPPYETPATSGRPLYGTSKISVKSWSNANTRYANSYLLEPNYKTGVKGKHKTSQRQPTFYLPSN
ncbi:uncharacterized protein LOC105428893 [Pogonomyrmex barbatus]|uniref:Uncharacterized protein LOC105428893 n=1 Tax=Pogonomyrmex barbatus TaxID=144034 RepID=A0A6I9X5S2_9HYME|nr:uncharacterized protein LOC105428893 [Pogonomyrmex barbatus]